VIINTPKKETIFSVDFFSPPYSIIICKHILSFEPAKIFPWLPLPHFITRSPLLEKKTTVIKDQIMFINEAMQRRFKI